MFPDPSANHLEGDGAATCEELLELEVAKSTFSSADNPVSSNQPHPI